MRKLKKRVKRIIFISLFTLIILVIGAYFITYYNDNKDSYVKVIKKSDILDEKGKKIGNIDKGIIINVNINNKGLCNIKNTDYYLSCDCFKEENKFEKDNKYSYYADLGKEITTNDKFSLINNDKSIIIDKSSKFKVKYMDTDYYYIDISNILFKINKKDISKEKEYNTHYSISDKISIITFSNISEECTTNECYKLEDVKHVLDYIKKSDYYTISTEDYLNWNVGNIKLKEKAVLLISYDEINNLDKEYSDMFNKYESEDGFTFLYNNLPNKINTNLSALNNYNVYSVYTLDTFKDMLDGKEIKDKFFEGDASSSVPVINYHFFYDLDKAQTNCHESICLDVKKFKEQLDYLRDKGYTTLTMNQFVKWLYGEIDVPKKSVLLTIDDGAYGTGFHNGNNLIPILEEYKMHATLFLISGWWDINNYKSSYLEIQSHTHDMHKKISCGAQLICATYPEIMNDLSLSVNTIGNNETFCYPFYEYDDEAIKALKDSGFRVAFAGGSVNATRNSNKFTVPRYPIHDSITLDEFIKMVN